MTVVVRLGGALLAATQDRYFLVGEPKRPIDWKAVGFEAPPHAAQEATSERIPWYELVPLESGTPPTVLASEPRLDFSVEGEVACGALHDRLAIRRNGSISERLWDLVVESSTLGSDGARNARWLAEIPSTVWETVRDSLLRCT